MQSFKLTKRMIKNLDYLLAKVGAVHEINGQKQAFPSEVFVSKNTYKQIRKFVRAAFKKEYPYLPKRKLDSSVGGHLLNLGPVELDGVKDGYVLVDTNKINRQALASEP